MVFFGHSSSNTTYGDLRSVRVRVRCVDFDFVLKINTVFRDEYVIEDIISCV